MMCETCSAIKPAKAYRHRWEMPMVWIATCVSLAAVALTIGVILADASVGLVSLHPDLREVLEGLADWGLIVLAGPVLIFVMRIWQAAGLQANSAKAGPQQFPELWALYCDLAARMEVSPRPELYVTNGNGVVNAYALSCSSRWK